MHAEKLQAIAEEFGTPVYVYDESVLRERCRELKNLVSYPDFIIDYSMKANPNPALLKIIRSEGLQVDAMSPGEILIAERAGYQPEEIFFIGNNVAVEELKFAVEHGVKISLDSISQLELFGRHFPGRQVSLRINTGIGAGHHKKVVTAGKETKFGIGIEQLTAAKEIIARHNLILIGLNQHIGSLFLEAKDFLASIETLLSLAGEFPYLEFVDFGGGLGIPYQKKDMRLDMEFLGRELDQIIERFTAEYGRRICFRIEPGRYPVAECGVLLGKVHAVKYNGDNKYIGTDVGFNVLMRPILYNSYHEIQFVRDGQWVSGLQEAATVVGNICESGDILARDRMLPLALEEDIVVIRDTGAYGHIMSSNYNARMRPGEVLITETGEVKLIRKRDTIEDLLSSYIWE